MIRSGEGALEQAAGRLQQALRTLEQRLEDARNAPPATAADDGQVEALRIDLRSARERERALESAAAEASATLGRAADLIRTALADDDDEPRADRFVGAAGPGLIDETAGERPDLDGLSDDVTDLHQPRFSHRNGDA